MKSGHPWPSGLAMEPSSGLLQARSSLLAFYAVFGLYGLSDIPHTFLPHTFLPHAFIPHTYLSPTPIYSPHLYPPHRYPPLSPFIPDVSDRCDALDRLL
jgi:hypothetical protein